MRGLILAVQFLTRLPTPRVADFKPEDLSRSAIWFPLVGLLIGTVLAMALWAGAQLDPWAGALAALLLWVWITGALHLDGLGDMADALGAAHRDPAKLLSVMKDPHAGSFAVVSIAMQLITKLVLLMLAAKAEVALWLLVLVPAWARFGPLMWSLTLPPLGSGSAERFAWEIKRGPAIGWALALILPVLIAPALLAAPIAVVAWRLYLKRRVGGVTGDLMGAGVEITETVTLAALVVAALAGVAAA
jgi:adenosylcobinamide-GDP ribazoletransferase